MDPFERATAVQILGKLSNELHSLPNDGVSRFLHLRKSLSVPAVKEVQRRLLYSESNDADRDGQAALPQLLDSIEDIRSMAYQDTDITLAVAGSALGTIPALSTGRPDIIKAGLQPFRSLKHNDLPLVSLAFSEPTGTSNAFAPSGDGLQATAVLKDGQWTVSGYKVWATSISGWYQTGPDLITLVCRDITAGTGGPSPNPYLLILLVPKSLLTSSNFRIVRHTPTAGLTATTGPLIRFEKLVVPDAFSHVVAHGQEALKCLGEVSKRGAVLTAAMGLGIIERAIDETLSFVRSVTQGGQRILVESETVKAKIVGMKMKLSQAAAWTRMAAEEVDTGGDKARRIALEAKVGVSESAVHVVQEAMSIEGVGSYDPKRSCLSGLLMDAMGLGLIGGSNESIRRTLATMVA